MDEEHERRYRCDIEFKPPSGQCFKTKYSTLTTIDIIDKYEKISQSITNITNPSENSLETYARQVGKLRNTSESRDDTN